MKIHPQHRNRLPGFASALRRVSGLSRARALVTYLVVTLVTLPSFADAKRAGNESTQGSDKDAGAQARLHFETANLAFEEERYAEAAREFETAHELKPHAAVLFNAAQAWQLAGAPERAADDYAQALARSELTDEQSEYARQALKSLRQDLGWIDVAGDRGIHAELEGQALDLPFTRHLSPGAHNLSATDSSGQTWTQEFTIRRDRPLKVYLRPPSPEPVTATEPSLDSHRSSNEDWPIRRTMGTVSLGAGAAFGLGSVLLGVATLNTNKKFEQSDYHDQSLHDRAVSLRTWTNVFALSGAVVGGTGLVLLLTDASQEEISLQLSPDRVALRSRF